MIRYGEAVGPVFAGCFGYMETVPRKLAIVRANRYMVDNSQFLIAYARYTVSNAWELTEYAMKRGKKGLIHVENLDCG